MGAELERTDQHSQTVARREPAVPAAGRIASRALPAAATTGVLVLGRYWHLHGAAHSVGDAVLLGSLAAGTAICGVMLGDGHGRTPATALGVAGGLAAAAIAGYAASLALPLVVWAVATTAAYSLARRHWRQDDRAERAHRHQVELQRGEHDHQLQLEALRTHAAEITGRYQVEAAAWQARALAETLTRVQIAPIDPRLLAPVDPQRLAISPTARAALAPSTLGLLGEARPPEPESADEPGATAA